MRPALIAALIVAACGGGVAPAPPPDAGAPDAGAPDAGSPDAGPPDAGSDAGAPDAGPDAGEPDAGPLTDGGWTPDYPINTAVPFWKQTFEDDFRGKPGQPDDAWCYDQLPAQCTIWPGADTNDCDMSDVSDPGMIPPLKANLAAALKLFRPDTDWNAAGESDVRAAYSDLLATRLKDLNKCTWSVYQMVNWMATDYNGRWSARFDPSRVTVDTGGKGYLQLSATTAPVQYDCIYGGAVGGPNCQVYAFDAGRLSTSISYWADANPAWPGIYYHPLSGNTCLSGDTFTGVNCEVLGFAPHFLDENGPSYWVDTDPRWPGVYYANATYRCRDNIDYSPDLHFRNLTCPILDGAILSMPAQNRATDHPRGFTQYEGRFEVKARIPKGLGAFPAAWLMPIEGGWPYVGGEIDILEARDNADEAYQTYHHGKCYDPSSGSEVSALDPNDCAAKGMASVHLDLGYTAHERLTGEFWKRDHVFSAEWSDGHIIYYVNGTRIGSIDIGETAHLDPSSAPSSLATYNASNFPTKPFYWILNHSTYVSDAHVSGWPAQTFLIDYVKVHARCTRNLEFCPCGGAFNEASASCTLGPGEPLHCANPPQASGGAYAAACLKADQSCPNGGVRKGSRCLVADMSAYDLRQAVIYTVDATIPGVTYAPSHGSCSSGGNLVNGQCLVATFARDLLESGIDYSADPLATPAGVYYTPDY